MRLLLPSVNIAPDVSACCISDDMCWGNKDYETDKVIQRSLRQELGGDVTMLIVAHRLQTIMDMDKIVSMIRISRNCS